MRFFENLFQLKQLSLERVGISTTGQCTSAGSFTTWTACKFAMVNQTVKDRGWKIHMQIYALEKSKGTNVKINVNVLLARSNREKISPKDVPPIIMRGNTNCQMETTFTHNYKAQTTAIKTDFYWVMTRSYRGGFFKLNVSHMYR